MATRVRFGPIERQGPPPARIITWPQIIGGIVLAVLVVGFATNGFTGSAAIMLLVGGVGLFYPVGEYRPVEWAVPLARWGRKRVSRRRFYIEGGALPGPLSDSVILAYEADDILGGNQ